MQRSNNSNKQPFTKIKITSPSTATGGRRSKPSKDLSNSHKSSLQTPSNFNQIERKQDEKIKTKIQNFFWVLQKTIQFMNVIKQGSQLYKRNRLTNKHLEVIEDLAYVKDTEKSNNIFQNISFLSGNKNKISNSTSVANSRLQKQFIWSKIKVFSPDSFYIFIWNLCILIITLFWLVRIPYIQSFWQAEDFDNVSISLRIICIGIFILDIISNFNTAYYKEGQLIRNRQKIQDNYIHGYFFVDVITTIGFSAGLLTKLWNLEWIFMIRIFQIGVMIGNFDEQWQLETKYSTAWTLTRLIFVLFFISHIFSCLFHYIGQYEYENDKHNWLVDRMIQEETPGIKYLNSFYFIMITMISVGYGDITPVTNLERFVITIVTIISSGIFGFIISMIGQIFQEKYRQSSKLKKKKYIITNYMKARGISQKCQVEVRKYIDYITKQEFNSPELGQQILTQIPIKLQEKVYLEFYGEIIQNMKMFGPYFSKECLKALSLKMKEKKYGPGEIIYLKDDLDKRLFYVYKGQICQYIEKQKQQDILDIQADQDINSSPQKNSINKENQQTLEESENYCEIDINSPGDVIGIDGFFGNKQRDSSLKSITVSHLIYINQKDVLQTLKNFPKDFQTYCQIKDEILMNEKKFYKRCYADGKRDHTVMDCDSIHYKPNKMIHVLRSLKSEDIIDRQEYNRTSVLSKKHSYIIRQEARKCLIELRRDLVQDLKEINSDYSSSTDSEGTQQYLDGDDKRFFYFTPVIKFDDQQDNEMYISDGYSVSLDESFVLQDDWDSFSEIQSQSSIIQQEELETSEKSQQRVFVDRDKVKKLARGESVLKPQLNNIRQLARKSTVPKPNISQIPENPQKRRYSAMHHLNPLVPITPSKRLLRQGSLSQEKPLITKQQQQQFYSKEQKDNITKKLKDFKTEQDNSILKDLKKVSEQTFKISKQMKMTQRTQLRKNTKKFTKRISRGMTYLQVPQNPYASDTPQNINNQNSAFQPKFSRVDKRKLTRRQSVMVPNPQQQQQNLQLQKRPTQESILSPITVSPSKSQQQQQQQLSYADLDDLNSAKEDHQKQIQQQQQQQKFRFPINSLSQQQQQQQQQDQQQYNNNNNNLSPVPKKQQVMMNASNVIMEDSMGEKSDMYSSRHEKTNPNNNSSTYMDKSSPLQYLEFSRKSSMVLNPPQNPLQSTRKNSSPLQQQQQKQKQQPTSSNDLQPLQLKKQQQSEENRPLIKDILEEDPEQEIEYQDMNSNNQNNKNKKKTNNFQINIMEKSDSLIDSPIIKNSTNSNNDDSIFASKSLLKPSKRESRHQTKLRQSSFAKTSLKNSMISGLHSQKSKSNLDDQSSIHKHSNSGIIDHSKNKKISVILGKIMQTLDNQQEFIKTQQVLQQQNQNQQNEHQQQIQLAINQRSNQFWLQPTELYRYDFDHIASFTHYYNYGNLKDVLKKLQVFQFKASLKSSMSRGAGKNNKYSMSHSRGGKNTMSDSYNNMMNTGKNQKPSSFNKIFEKKRDAQDFSHPNLQKFLQRTNKKIPSSVGYLRSLQIMLYKNQSSPNSNKNSNKNIRNTMAMSSSYQSARTNHSKHSSQRQNTHIQLPNNNINNNNITSATNMTASSQQNIEQTREQLLEYSVSERQNLVQRSKFRLNSEKFDL